MRVIPPIEITDGMFTSSTVSEPDTGETAWSAATAYPVGAICFLASTHRKYEARTAHTNKDPALATIDTPSTDWMDAGPTNKWAMFDTLRSTGSVDASPLTVVITPGRRVDSIGFAGLVADAVTITMTSGATTVYSHTETLSTRQVGNWYQFFFAPFTYKAEFALFDLPPFTNGVITVTATRATGDVEIGACVIGMNEYIGRALQDADDDALNFSTINRTFDGSSVLVRRRSVPKNNFELLLDKSQLNRVRGLRDDLNAVPAVYVGLDDDNDGYYSSLFRLGVYKQFRFKLSHPQHVRVSLEVEEI